MKWEDVESMTLKQIEDELNAIISDMKESITAEEASSSKSANNTQYKERLRKAEEIKKDIEEYKQNKSEKDYDEFLLDVKSEMFDFSMPIY